MFDTDEYEMKMEDALEHFHGELKKVRTGRAHVDMLDGITVEAYGTKMPLVQVGNVTVPEPQLLQVNPFDPSTTKSIVDAIRDSGRGFNPSDDGRIVRVPIPALNEERRKEMVKTLGGKVEECRVAMRTIRQDAFKDAKRKKEAKEMGEDDVVRVEKEIDKLMGDYQAKIDTLYSAKEKEVMTV